MNSSKERELFENKPVLKAVFSLALPSVLAQLLSVLYGLADSFFIGMNHDDVMVAALNICLPAFLFLSAISNLFGIGASSVLDRAFGEGKKEKARKTSAFAFYGALVSTLLYCLLAYFLRNPFLDLLGGKEETLHQAAMPYFLLTVVLGGLPAMLSTLFSHLLRSQGRSLEASLGVVLGGLLNVVLDPIFMFVCFPEREAVFAVGLATLVSNLATILYFVLVFLLRRKRLVLSFLPSKGMFGEKIPQQVLSAGTPAFLMTFCENVSFAVLDNLMSQVSLPAQAGLGIAKKIAMFAHCGVRGMAQGVLPLIAYNKASGNRKRMKEIVKVSLLGSVLMALLFLLLDEAAARPLVSLFLGENDSGSLDYGIRFLRILSLGAPFSAVAYTVISFFQAVGKGGESLFVALLRKGLLDIPMMYLLGLLQATYGPVIATPVTDVLCSLVALFLFFRYLKKHGQNKGRFASDPVPLSRGGSLATPDIKLKK